MWTVLNGGGGIWSSTQDPHDRLMAWTAVGPQLPLVGDRLPSGSGEGPGVGGQSTTAPSGWPPLGAVGLGREAATLPGTKAPQSSDRSHRVRSLPCMTCLLTCLFRLRGGGGGGEALGTKNDSRVCEPWALDFGAFGSGSLAGLDRPLLWDAADGFGRPRVGFQVWAGVWRSKRANRMAWGGAGYPTEQTRTVELGGAEWGGVAIMGYWGLTVDQGDVTTRSVHDVKIHRICT